MKYSDAERERLESMLKSTRITKSVAWYEKVMVPRFNEHKDKYQRVAEVIGCPPAFIALIHLREHGSDVGKFKTYIGNGQPLTKKTTIVPKGRGPFKSWEDGAIDALKLKGIDKITDWTLERMLFELERYNGFGYRQYGVNTPYVWNFTNHYTRGHFYKDHKFSLSKTDGNIGTYAFYVSLTNAEPSWAITAETNLDNFPVVDDAKESPEWLQDFILMVVTFFRNIFGTQKSKKAVEGTRNSRNRQVLIAVEKEIGVKEVPGTAGSNPRIDEYFDASEDDGTSNLRDHIPWCAALICFLCKVVGMGLVPSLRLLARSWEHWGVSTMDDPLPGDWVIMWRGSRASGKGHIFVFLKKLSNGDYVGVGGNQNDEVNVATFKPNRVTDVRRSSKSIKHTAEERAELISMAEDIINGNDLKEYVREA